MANDSGSGMRIRDGLSLLFAVGGFLVILVLGGIAIICNSDRAEHAHQTLVIILPLVASWVGTVIAYYFSKENLAAATSSVATLSKGMVDLARLQTIPVKSAMLPRGQIITLPSAMTNPWSNLEKTLLADLLNFLDINKKATRLPIMKADDTIVYMIHVSIIYEYVTKMSRATPPKIPATLTFNDLITDPSVAAMAGGFVTVSVQSTLDHAKAAMDRMPNCEDVFVTEDGTATKPVVGWISDDAIWAAARV